MPLAPKKSPKNTPKLPNNQEEYSRIAVYVRGVKLTYCILVIARKYCAPDFFYSNLPEFGGIFLLDFAPLIDKVSIFLQEIDSFLRVGRNRVVLVLK